MFEIVDDMKNYGPMLMLLVGFGLMFVSGIYFGVIYYVMGLTETSLQSVSCNIESNSLVTTCQELFNLSIYPFIAMKDIFIWFSFLFIFALVIGMLLVGYKSGNSPVLMGLMVVFIMGITYLGILISNIYRTMLEVDAFRLIMLDFTVYNKLMLYFPWFTFFVGIFAVMLSMVNYQRTRVNSIEGELDY